MINWRSSSKRACFCPNPSLPFSSALLFLSLVLPSSSYAQVSSEQPPPQPTSNPTNLLASAIATSSTTTSQSASSTPSFAAPTTPASTPAPPPGSRAFSYYFVIVAIAAIIFCFGVFFLGRRRRQKAAVLRTNSRNALAQDVAGFRVRFGIPRNYNSFTFGFNGGANRLAERIEGLDERGEAPPPYVPGSKPPSLRSTDRASTTSNGERYGGVIEMTRLGMHNNGETGNSAASSRESHENVVEPTRPSSDHNGGANHDIMNNDPPEYNEHTGSEGFTTIARPDTAITASESTRRLNASDGSEYV